MAVGGGAAQGACGLVLLIFAVLVPTLPPPAHGSRSSRPSDATACAAVFSGSLPSTGAPLAVFCASPAQACIWPQPLFCTNPVNGSRHFVQAAIDAAAAASAATATSNGQTTTTVPTTAAAAAVLVSPGRVVVTRPLVGWPPLGRAFGFQVPSRVHVYGAGWLSPALSSVFAVQPPLVLDAMFVLSQRISGWNRTLAMPPVVNASIQHVVIDGGGQATAATPTAGAGPSTPLAACAGNLPPAAMTLTRGILGGLAAGGVLVANVTVAHCIGNAIELGLLDPWTPERPADLTNPLCNSTGFCPARRLMFAGTEAQPNRILDNVVCDARFGGVTIIGSQVEVARNTLAVSVADWVSPNASFGMTMAVSAAFVGSSAISVHNNTLSGASYGIGTDGSYNLYHPVGMFVHFWPQVCATFPDMKRRFPRGPPLDSHGNLAFNQTADYVRAQQVLFDLAVEHFAASSNASVYNAGFNANLTLADNTIHSCVCGVSLYRVFNSTVLNNTIIAAGSNQTLAMYGLSLVAAHNNYAAGNRVEGRFAAGIRLAGVPLANSHLGCSFNGIGVAHPGSPTAPELDQGNVLVGVARGVVFEPSGYDNAVRNNTVQASGEPCDYSGARRLRKGVDWTTGNVPASCNRDYSLAYADATQTTDALAS